MIKEIPYIESLPSDWNVIPNRYLFYYDGKKVGDEHAQYQLLSLTTAGVKKRDINATGGKVPTSYDNYQTVKKGQMVFCLFDLDCSAVFSGISEYDGMITSAYDVFSTSDKMDTRYADYWFKYVFSNRYYKMYSKNIRYTITGDMFRALKTPVPPLEVQKQISSLLHNQEQKIDNLIANVQAQIEKLKAYKQSLITEVVTKGLDPNAPMKDSGVEWMGKINAEYDVRTIRSLFTIRKDIIGHEPDRVLSITQKGLRVKNIAENEGQMADSYAKYQIVRVGDFAMNHMDLLTGGIGIADVEGVTSPDYRVFAKKDPTYCSRYFLYVFESYYRNKIFYAFGQGAANMGRWRLPAQNFNKMLIPVPKVDDQYVLASHLDAKCAQIEQLISLKESKIEKLQQYKRSLIYEYVTGKKEVV